MADHEVWGFKICTSSSGRKIWPEALKLEAVRRIDEEGASPGEIGAEIDANEGLVRKWHVAMRRARGDTIADNRPAFAEVKLRPDSRLDTVNTNTLEQARIIVGAVCIEFPLSIDEANLAKLVRVAGAAT